MIGWKMLCGVLVRDVQPYRRKETDFHEIVMCVALKICVDSSKSIRISDVSKKKKKKNSAL